MVLSIIFIALFTYKFLFFLFSQSLICTFDVVPRSVRSGGLFGKNVFRIVAIFPCCTSRTSWFFRLSNSWSRHYRIMITVYRVCRAPSTNRKSFRSRAVSRSLSQNEAWRDHFSKFWTPAQWCYNWHLSFYGSVSNLLRLCTISVPNIKYYRSVIWLVPERFYYLILTN